MPLETVLIVGDFANINGGQAKVSIDSARLLADHGVNVMFFASYGEPDPQLDHPKISVECLGIPDILSEKSRLKAMSRGIWNGRAKSRLREITSELDPTTTILHCHGYAKALSPSIGPELVNGPLSSIYTMHEYFLACPNGGFYDYQRNEICTRKALGASCLSTNCDVRHPAHKAWRVARQAATWGPGRMPGGLRDVIYISETQRKAMAPYISAKTRLHHVPNPVPIPDLPSVKASENDLFLFIGRFNPEKGAAMFAEAARQAGVRAAFIGDGADEEKIRAANPDAELLGWKRPAEVQEWIGRARALVFPSLWYEGQPLVPMEALARGVPVVCGTWSAAAEYVENGINGVHYLEPSASALTSALAQAAELPDFDAGAIRAAVDPQQHLKKLLDVYDRLLG